MSHIFFGHFLRGFYDWSYNAGTSKTFENFYFGIMFQVSRPIKIGHKYSFRAIVNKFSYEALFSKYFKFCGSSGNYSTLVVVYENSHRQYSDSERGCVSVKLHLKNRL